MRKCRTNPNVSAHFSSNIPPPDLDTDEKRGELLAFLDEMRDAFEGHVEHDQWLWYSILLPAAADAGCLFDPRHDLAWSINSEEQRADRMEWWEATEEWLSNLADQIQHASRQQVDYYYGWAQAVIRGD